MTLNVYGMSKTKVGITLADPTTSPVGTWGFYLAYALDWPSQVETA